MQNYRIPLATPHMSDEGYEMEFIKEAFKTNWIAPLGKNVTEFENELAEYVGIKHAAALSSGTAAIHMALKAAGVGQGDIVFCQSLTFAATANPIIYQNATPVFIDSEYETWNMDPDALEEAFRKYPKAKAVIVVHLYGIPANMDRILEICRRHGAVLIEDAAESLGSKYRGVHTGTIGDYGIYSFNGNKIITTSGGGMLVSSNKECIEKVRFWATQSRDKAKHYQHSELGYNYRMSNICAGIGRGQLMVLEQRVEKKRAIYEFYKEKLSSISGVKIMPNDRTNRMNCWLSCILFENGMKPIDAIEILAAAEIESRPTWKPMHMQPYYGACDVVNHGVATDIFNRGLCLPSDTKICLNHLDRVIKAIKTIVKRSLT